MNKNRYDHPGRIYRRKNRRSLVDWLSAFSDDCARVGAAFARLAESWRNL